MASRLADARSGYLRSAAHQPIEWWPWGSEAFARATEEQKPILLDVGASWCHWCHVMDRESYEDGRIAEFVNRHFIPIKVDRDERPDVDARYQRAVQGLSGQGGWPLTAFLTPNGDVFFGGTYFPPDDRHGRPGLLSLLRRVVQVFRAEPERVAAQAAEVAEFVTKQLDEGGGGGGGGGGAIDREVLDRAVARIVSAADREYGGFGGAPKFPHPTTMLFLLHRLAGSGAADLRSVIETTLDGMALGGFRDQLGGGFHRYGVDRRWVIPHFEKLASDNAELLRCYVAAASWLDRPIDREVIGATVRWVTEVLADPAGGYHASQDADQGPADDGDYFTWTIDEIDRCLTADEANAAVIRFGLSTHGRMPHDPARNVLYLAETIPATAERIGRPVAETAALLESAVAKLRSARAARPAPAVDPTRYAGWNAMVAGAMLAAGLWQDDPPAVEHAVRSMVRLRDEQPDPDRVAHCPGGVSGLLEDQVQTAHTALDLFEYSGDPAWLDWAGRLMGRTVADLWDEERGGFFDAPVRSGATGLIAVPAKPIQDSPTPSPNGVAGVVLARLFEHTGDAHWDAIRRRLIDAFADRAVALGLYASSYLLAVDWLLEPVTHLVVSGPIDDPLAQALHRAALTRFLPRRVVVRVTGDRTGHALPRAAIAQGIDPGRPAGYRCTGDRCLAPAFDLAAWRDRLAYLSA